MLLISMKRVLRRHKRPPAVAQPMTDSKIDQQHCLGLALRHQPLAREREIGLDEIAWIRLPVQPRLAALDPRRATTETEALSIDPEPEDVAAQPVRELLGDSAVEDDFGAGGIAARKIGLLGQQN